jgi:hypothetical protein
MGVIGMMPIEPVIFETPIAGELLHRLIGSHGTKTSVLLNRISVVLAFQSRPYSDNLLNFDDLVGYQTPSGLCGVLGGRHLCQKIRPTLRSGAKS